MYILFAIWPSLELLLLIFDDKFGNLKHEKSLWEKDVSKLIEQIQKKPSRVLLSLLPCYLWEGFTSKDQRPYLEPSRISTMKLFS